MSRDVRVRRHISNLGLALVIAGGGLYALSSLVLLPGAMTQGDFRHIGTAGRFESLPWKKPIALMSDMSQVGAGRDAGGSYDPAQQVIDLDLTSSHTTRYLNAILPHEYGHVLMHDFLNVRFDHDARRVNGAWIATLAHHTEVIRRHELPDELEPLVADYVAQPEEFGPYGSRSFGEWFAEAFAAYVHNDDVPAATRRFFDSVSHMRAGEGDCTTCHTSW